MWGTLWKRPVCRVAVVTLIAVSAASCGSGGESPNAEPAAAPSESEGNFPVAVSAANGKVTLEERPERIVSLSPTATEMLFAVGAGDQVIAADDNSNFPAEAPTTELSGFEPNVEAIVDHDPDLVVVSATGQVMKALTTLGIPVLVQPAATDLDDSYEQISQLGVVTGHEAEAEALVDSMRSEIVEIVSSVPEFDSEPTYYHELDDAFFTVTSDTFIGQIYSLLGLRNIADRAQGAESGYPQLSVEYIVDADPDLIFLADTKCCDQSEQTVAARAGWDHISAVENGAVVELDDDIASRWGPRVVDFLRAVAAELQELDEAA